MKKTQQYSNYKLTLGLSRGFSSANFLAAASIAEAAPSNSFSAITFGSSGFTQSEPSNIKAVSFLFKRHAIKKKCNDVDVKSRQPPTTTKNNYKNNLLFSPLSVSADFTKAPRQSATFLDAATRPCFLSFVGFCKT